MGTAHAEAKRELVWIDTAGFMGWRGTSQPVVSISLTCWFTQHSSQIPCPVPGIGCPVWVCATIIGATASLGQGSKRRDVRTVHLWGHNEQILPASSGLGFLILLDFRSYGFSRYQKVRLFERIRRAVRVRSRVDRCGR